jgi:hypothetical protein
MIVTQLVTKFIAIGTLRVSENKALRRKLEPKEK